MSHVRLHAALIGAFVIAALLPAQAAYALTAAEVVDDGIVLDGTTVTLVGEAVGEDLRADSEHRWINLRSEGTGVGIYVTNKDADVVETYGSYKTTGDLISASGTLNVACDQHAGEFDIHVDYIERTDTGQPIEDPLDWWKVIVGLIAGGIGFMEWRLLGRLRNREDA